MPGGGMLARVVPPGTRPSREASGWSAAERQVLRRAGRDWNRARATQRPRSQATSNLLSLRDALHSHPACDEGTESATAHKVA
eukprot:997562-Prymnesium_polylepis.1